MIPCCEVRIGTGGVLGSQENHSRAKRRQDDWRQRSLGSPPSSLFDLLEIGSHCGPGSTVIVASDRNHGCMAHPEPEDEPARPSLSQRTCTSSHRHWIPCPNIGDT